MTHLTITWDDSRRRRKRIGYVSFSKRPWRHESRITSWEKTKNGYPRKKTDLGWLQISVHFTVHPTRVVSTIMDLSTVSFNHLIDLILLRQNTLLESSLQRRSTSNIFLQRTKVPLLEIITGCILILKARSLATPYCITQPFVAKLKPYRYCLPPSKLHQTDASYIWQLKYVPLLVLPCWRVTERRGAKQS